MQKIEQASAGVGEWRDYCPVSASPVLIYRVPEEKGLQA